MSRLVAYDRAKRFLLCDHCGAPVEVDPAVGSAACGHCRAPIEVRMRPEAAAVPPRAKTEAERLALLAGQDRRFFPPPDLVHLFAGERIAPAGEPEARGRWQGLRAALRTESAPIAVEQFFVLTLGLSEAAFERGDFVGQRALVDSALALLTGAREQQALRAQLSRSALRAGDPAAAEAWLALCDERSEDLFADTAYRHARAYADTAKGDFAAVIRGLGVGGDVPLSHAYAPECAVLCANAWERLGERATAIDALVAVKRELGPIARRRIRRFIAAHGQWQLCPQSELEAERRVADLDPTPVEGSTVGLVLLAVMGGFSLLWAGSGVLLPILLPLGEGDLLNYGISIFTGGLLAVLLLPITLGSALRSRRRKGTRTSAVAYPAHVLERRTLGDGEHAEQMTIELSLLIVPDDAPAYHSKIETGIIRDMVENFAPGKMLIARIASRDPHEYSLEIV